MLQTDGGLVRKKEKNGEFWNVPDGSLGKCRLDGSWFIVGGQRTLVKQGNKHFLTWFEGRGKNRTNLLMIYDFLSTASDFAFNRGSLLSESE